MTSNSNTTSMFKHIIDEDAYLAHIEPCDAVTNRAPRAHDLFLRKPCVKPRKPARRTGSAQREVERANMVEPFDALLAFAANQRMLQQGQQRYRRHVLRKC